MGKPQTALDERAIGLIERSHFFFIATAPKSLDGHINVSPKGLNCFKVITPTLFAYLDYPGSGTETIAHIRENGRVTVMFCAFDGDPLILRIYGGGKVIFPTDPEYAGMLKHFPDREAGVRSIITVETKRVSTSCGFGVPLMKFEGNREQLTDWMSRKGEAKLIEFQLTRNLESIDGIEGIPPSALDESKNA